MERTQVSEWIEQYERAWRAPGTDPLRRLFTEDAEYWQGPYLEPRRGLAEIAAMWEETRDGPNDVFRMAHQVVAVDGDTAVARVEVWYGEPVTHEYRDLWVMRFAGDGRCRSYEEWPFAPTQPITAA
jgi:ketosteroid isomerase-like protein